MKPFFALFLLTLSITHSFAQAKIPKDQLVQDLAVLKQNLETYHAGLHTYTSPAELDAWFVNTQAQLPDSLTSYEFFRIIGQLNSVLANGHTYLHINPAQREPHLKIPAFGIYKYQTSYYFKSSTLSPYQSLVGSEIVAIDGQPIGEIFQSLLAYRTRDGQNETMPSEELQHYFALTYGLVYGSRETILLSYKDSSGQIKELSMETVPAEGNVEPSAAELLYDEGGIHFERHDTVGVLTVETFSQEALEKVGYLSRLQSIFREIKEAGVRHLIVDVRNNGGGNTPMVEALLSYLYDQPFVFYKGVYQAHKQWDTSIIPEVAEYPKISFGWAYLKKDPSGLYRILFTDGIKQIKPKPDVYTGPLYILGNGNSLSSSGEFASFIRHYREATFIGEEVGGNQVQNTSGQDLIIQLPHSKLLAKIPFVLWKMNVDTENNGHGVQPDYWIRNTIQQELNQEDAVMKFTLDYIANPKK
ncbi:MAG: S41 family peptidase [Bacteroidota bacterium]